MPNRAQRRATARQQSVAAAPRQSVQPPAVALCHPLTGIPEPGAPLPSLAKIAANQANAQRSTGPRPESFHITSENRTVHGLTRHNGVFKLLPTEDPAAFAAFQQSLIDEHSPSTPTEEILVNAMAEYHWLANRAQLLQDDLFDPLTGHIPNENEKRFSLYLRYQTTHTRNFHKSLNDLIKLRAAARKQQLGFEAQRIQSERHEMKKQGHYWDVLLKDGKACHQLLLNRRQISAGIAENPGFEAQCHADLAAQRLELDKLNGALAPIPASEALQSAA